ncbi:MAG: hypothetical protein JXK93_09060 [Sphaerochaetaceae bacterium]|nr:hypothetical protein [Sphaerochaetaceae bacterium]
MYIAKNYSKNDKPVDLIMRLEEGMEVEGTESLMNTIKNLRPECLPSKEYTKKLLLQLKNQPQRQLILWILLLMRYHEWRIIKNYITAFSIALHDDIIPALALEAKAWLRQDLREQIRNRRIATTLKTMDDIYPCREQYPHETNPQMWSFITNILVNIYETHQ